MDMPLASLIVNDEMYEAYILYRVFQGFPVKNFENDLLLYRIVGEWNQKPISCLANLLFLRVGILITTSVSFNF